MIQEIFVLTSLSSVILPQLGCLFGLTKCLEKRHGKVATKKSKVTALKDLNTFLISSSATAVFIMSSV